MARNLHKSHSACCSNLVCHPRVIAVCLMIGLLFVACSAQEVPTEADSRPVEPPNPFAELVTKSMKLLSPDAEVWIDKEAGQLFVLGNVSAREAPLEMFACPKGTKEYESVVAVDSSAQLVHAGLLALGAEPGSPMQFDPKYVPAHGPVIEVTVQWLDGDKMQSARAQEWVQNVTTGKELDQDWVFAGSGFWTDPESGKEFYRAEGGELICVSNFSTATMDLPVVSTQDNANLVFFTFTDRIPPLGTPVRLVLSPQLDK